MVVVLVVLVVLKVMVMEVTTVMKEIKRVKWIFKNGIPEESLTYIYRRPMEVLRTEA